MSAFDQFQTNPHYFHAQTATHAQYAAQQYSDPAFQPRSFADAVHDHMGEHNTFAEPEHTPLRQVRNGQMPSNMYVSPSLLRKWGLDPAKQVYDAPLRRKRWFNDPNTFITPPKELPAKLGFKRVIRWQEYEQDKVHARLQLQKAPLGFGRTPVGYLRVPMEYRPLTQEEQLYSHNAHAFVEDDYKL